MNLREEPFTREVLQSYLRDRLIPELNQPAPLIVSGSPPVHPPPGITVDVRSAPLLRNVKPASGFGQEERWPQEGLNSMCFPCFIAVLDGEADLELGVTRRMAAQNSVLSKECSRYLVTLPVSSFLILPPRQPLSDAGRPHWDPARAQPSSSSLLWGKITPSGAALHICHSNENQHFSPRSLFVSDLQLHSLMEMLLDEMVVISRHSATLQRTYLLSLLLRLDRSLDTQAIETKRPDEISAHASSEIEQSTPSFSSPTVLRACRYIDTHLNERLTVDGIAAHSYVSVTHLNRLFQKEMQMAIMQYVISRRIARAQVLLGETDLSIRRIAAVVGYSNSDQFGRIFRRQMGENPSAFRQRRKKAR